MLLTYSLAKRANEKYIDIKLNRVLHSGPNGPGTRSPHKEGVMYRFAALITVVAAAVLAVADIVGGGH
jgi:hypothetical protein